MNTKFLIVFVAFFALAFAKVKYSPSEIAVAPRAGINDKIMELIEILKEQMPCGIPHLGVPILAPFKTDYAEIKKVSKLAEFIISIFDVHVDGLNHFNVNSVSLSVLTLKMKFDFTFKEIQAKSQYVANAILLKFIRIKGDGDAKISLKDLRIVGEAQIGANATTKALYMRDFKLTIVLGQFKSDITGLLWGKLTGKLANNMIEKLVPFLLKHKHEEVTDVAREIVINLANEKLKNLTIKDLLDLINKKHDPVECIPPKEKMTFADENIVNEEFSKLIEFM